MLRSLKDLEGYTVSASDGDIGHVVNFLLDDERWIIRYLVAETGGGLFEQREVLISPVSFRQVEWAERQFHLELTRDKVRNSPSVETNRPVSRQYESDFSRYYKYPPYWAYTGPWGMGAYPRALAVTPWIREDPEPPATPPDIHLRSAGEVRGYHIEGLDEEIGHIEDFIIDDESWEVRYLVVDTSNWWFGKKVLVAPHWASRISWEESRVYLNMSRANIKDAPEWDAHAAINREYEVRLYDYFGRPAYWDRSNER